MQTLYGADAAKRGLSVRAGLLIYQSLTYKLRVVTERTRLKMQAAEIKGVWPPP